MVGKSEIKFIKSLHQKKYRILNQCFIAEGEKVIRELLDSDFELQKLYTTTPGILGVSEAFSTKVSEAQLSQISGLKTPNKVLAVFKMRPSAKVDPHGICLLLDDVRDPGNFGTIIRLCDWFGVDDLVCSRETVDMYNPKVVMSTMGSLSRVNIVYVDLPEFVKNDGRPVVVTRMEGENVYRADLEENVLLVMGNEANGVSETMMKIASGSLSIPRFGKLQETESLNVATATAILLSEYRRRSINGK
ncbi:TrmH family RNA methyltransferase [Robertkochia solimangrovi]|uniref:TrmH family RNA methyltransferase n=1 Tax=Robertkochia solimangrovi TaxID=2213046 RepID=UPI00117EE704|nr:RNA methyltransferase [Robertkochia solimangrovi]TRZ41383.1 RNA methyltransferase [Robertkochia solimangrovi]